ncbi:hypothetical protein GCM10020254_43210 [Streptomyces goshikiensis]
MVLGLWRTVERHEPEGEGRAVLDVLANLLHNAGMLVIMAEVCLIYATAGWYKIQGSRWQDGTALYYPLRLDYFTPWPALSGVLAGSGVLVMLLSYGTVAVQVAFPFTLFNRRIKNVLLAAMMLEHAGIAVLLGLPFFFHGDDRRRCGVLAHGVFLVWLGGPGPPAGWGGGRGAWPWPRSPGRGGGRGGGCRGGAGGGAGAGGARRGLTTGPLRGLLPAPPFHRFSPGPSGGPHGSVARAPCRCGAVVGGQPPNPRASNAGEAEVADGGRRSLIGGAGLPARLKLLTGGGGA